MIGHENFTVKIQNSPSRLFVFIVLVSLLASLVLFSSIAHAAPVVGFNAGNIIDDLVFTNKNSMDVSQIQSFLNSKVPTCDTWGTQPSEYGGGTRAQWAANASLHPSMGAFYPPFTCLKDYSENGKSAAQIIYDVAQQFNINPQTLIVLLQKEQSLVTDTWPSPTQYRTATGYGCPDTAPCDSQYYGLTNQLRWSGTMFRAILDNSPTWYTPYILGNNTVYYNPGPYNNTTQSYYGRFGTSRDIEYCGSTVVNIQNRATQALYNYTPYQPNQASLDAGYGTAPPCGSYGNRNFYLYFTDWFGTVRSNDTLKPHPDGTLISMDNRVYLIEAGTLHYITNASIFESYSYRWQDVKPATSGDKQLALSWQIDSISPGQLYAAPGTSVYTTIYQNGEWVKQVVSYASFISLRYSWSQVRYISPSDLPSATSNDIYFSNQHPDGTLIKNTQGVFLIDHGTKRYISPAVFESHRWLWSDIVDESSGDTSLPVGANMLLRRGTIISDGSGLYVVELPTSGPEIKRPIGPWECYSNIYRYTLEEIISLPAGASPQQTGTLVTC